MQPLSPHYKNDGIEGLNSGVKAYLDSMFLKNIVNIQREMPKLLVVFSGGNAVGKTTMSDKIQDELGGLVIENDEIKRCIIRRFDVPDRDELNRLTWQYSMDLYARLSSVTNNGFVVRDGIIDWYYDRILPVFIEAGYPIFIIAFDVSKDKAIELIKQRGDTPTVQEERFYTLLQDHEIHMKRFRSKYTPDITLTDENIFDHDRVIKKLRNRLRELGASV